MMKNLNKSKWIAKEVKNNFKNNINVKKDFVWPLIQHYLIITGGIVFTYLIYKQQKHHFILGDPVIFYTLFGILGFLILVLPFLQYHRAVAISEINHTFKKIKEEVQEFYKENVEENIVVSPIEIQKLSPLEKEQFWQLLYKIKK